MSDGDLSFITGSTPPLWAANPRQNNQREDQFLKSLDIDEWSWSELARSVSELEDNERDNIEEWISSKDDVWLMRFYALLGEACIMLKDKIFIDVSNLRIVRVDSFQGHEHVIPKKAYFPPEDRMLVAEINFVKASVYRTGASNSQKTFSESFLKQIGVIPFNERVVIEQSLEQYNQSQGLIKPDYISNIKKFVAYWKKNQSDVSLFKGYPFLLGYSDQGTVWCNSSQLCLDSPYIDTGFAELTSIHKKLVLHDEYKNNLSEIQCKDFIEFLKAIGVMRELSITKVDIQSHPKFNQFWSDFNWAGITHHGINEDYTISDLISYLKKKSVSASRLVWKAVVGATSEKAKARFSPNKQHNYHPRNDDSQLVHHLKSIAWIPDKNGSFCHPQDVAMHELRSDFPYDNKNGLLSAIGFGEQSKMLSKDNLAKDEAAKSFGFSSASEINEWIKVKESGITPSEILAKYDNKKRISQPEDTVRDPRRRKENILADSADAPSKESIILERSIQKGISDVSAQAKAYLRTKYKNADGQLVCQCCHEEMPFKLLGTGEYYFEAVQCVTDKESRHFQNRLALCPTCAAMYQHARKTGDNEVRRRIVEYKDDQASFVEIPVHLTDREFTLRFVGTHWFDLKTVLSQ